MICNIDEGTVHHFGPPKSAALSVELLHHQGHQLLSMLCSVMVAPGKICGELKAAVSGQELVIRIHSALFQHAPPGSMYWEGGWLNSAPVPVSFFALRKALKLMLCCLKHSPMARMTKDRMVWWSHWKSPVGVFP